MLSLIAGSSWSLCRAARSAHRSRAAGRRVLLLRLAGADVRSAALDDDLPAWAKVRAKVRIGVIAARQAGEHADARVALVEQQRVAHAGDDVPIAKAKGISVVAISPRTAKPQCPEPPPFVARTYESALVAARSDEPFTMSMSSCHIPPVRMDEELELAESEGVQGVERSREPVRVQAVVAVLWADSFAREGRGICPIVRAVEDNGVTRRGHALKARGDRFGLLGRIDAAAAGPGFELARVLVVQRQAVARNGSGRPAGGCERYLLGEDAALPRTGPGVSTAEEEDRGVGRRAAA